MEKPSVTKRFHFVPQFHIKKWLDKDKMINIYQLSPKKEFKTIHEKGIKNFCVESGLYAAPILYPFEKDIVETDFFAPLDDRASRIMNSLPNGKILLPKKEKSDLLEYIQLLYYRHPKMINKLISYNKQYPCFEHSKEDEIKDYTVTSFLRNQPIASKDFFVDLDWYKLETSKELIFGDTPYVQFGGMNKDIYCVMVALDPQHLLITRKNWDRINPNLHLCSFTETYNEYILRQANKFVFFKSNILKKGLKAQYKKIINKNRRIDIFD